MPMVLCSNLFCYGRRYYFFKRWANGLYYFYFDFCLSGSYSFWMARRSDHDSDCFCNDVKCLWSISQFSISREFNDSTYDTLLHNISHQWCCQRIEMYHIAKTMIAKRPWFGYGTGGINTEMQKIIPAKDRVLNSRMNFVESIYLNFLLEFGVVGFAVLLIAIAFQIQQSFLLTHEYRSLIHIVLINVFIGGLINKFFQCRYPLCVCIQARRHIHRFSTQFHPLIA